MDRKCKTCAKPATMASTNVNVNGHWYFCTRHMRAAIQYDRDNYHHSHQYVWPLAGMDSATPAQRALARPVVGR